ncbi:tlde1 domain-containing protein [Paraburkholderia sp.]|uniref:tlde1 domain-containing protein n=1 Tax=Paraburkholderia sp. TaxID=1926495 RepID=UPI003D6FCF54
MPWTYSQNTGRLSHDGALAGIGYSGRDAGKNNSATQMQEGVGPIPRGTYKITAPFTHPHTGIYSMRLIPQPGTQTFGRSGFLMHGDSVDHPGEASDGCIVQSLGVRHQVWASGDRTLVVTQ